MTMNLKKCFLAACMMLLPAVMSQAQMMPDIPFDPAVRKGVLPNGLTYYIRHNEWPEKRINFYIAQKVGSMQEEDDQKGLAHFLEHMCFNGTKHYPGDNLKQYLERIGVKFGENLNAYTSFDEIVYNVDNVNAEIPGVVDSCLYILHDWSHDLLLEDKEIDKERGVINEEWRMRRSAQQRMLEDALPVLFEGSKYAHRMPIGTMDVVMNFKYDELRRYYRKWFRPDLQGIVIVGDVDVDVVEAKIKDIFSDIQPVENGAVREYYPVPDNSEPIVFVAKDKEQPISLMQVMFKREAFPDSLKKSPLYLIQGYINQAMESMFEQRMEEIRQKANPPFIQAGLGYGEYLVAKTKEAFYGVTVFKDNGFKDALTVLSREMLRAVRHGFTVNEYNRFKDSYKSALDDAYAKRDKITNDDYTTECINHFKDNEPMPGIEWEYQTMSQVAEAIPLEVINKYMTELVTDSNLAVIMFEPDKEDIITPSKEDILAVLESVKAEDILPYQEEVSDEPLISQLPKKGKVKKVEEDVFGTTRITLSNGINVWVKQTDYEPNQISMEAVSWGGNAYYPDDDIVNTSQLGLALVGGLGNFSSVDLNKKLSGKRVSVNSNVGPNAESVNGSCVKKDLETMLQCVYLSFTSPRRDQEAFDSRMDRMRASLANQDMQPTTALVDTVVSVVYSNHPRARRMKAQDVDKIDYDRILHMYKERFADGNDFDFFFVGDINLDSLKPLLEQYVATLPVLKSHEDERPITLAMANGNRKNVFEKEQQTPNAIVQFIYHTPMAYNAKNEVVMDYLDQIMTMVYTQTVREDEGGAYSVGTQGSVTFYPKEEASFLIALPTAPDKREHMTEIIYQGVEDMVANGPKQEDVDKVREYLLRTYDENIKKNSYWLSVIQRKVRRGLDFHSDYQDVVKSVTAEDIRQMAEKVFHSGNRFEVGMTSPLPHEE